VAQRRAGLIEFPWRTRIETASDLGGRTSIGLLRSYYLRCAAAGIGGGLLLLFTDASGTPWRGLALLFVGFVCLALAIHTIRTGDAPRARKPAIGPAFDVDIPADPAAATTTANLVRQVRDSRGRQKRADD